MKTIGTLAMAAGLLSAQGPPIIRGDVSPKSRIIVGQPVRVTISVLVPNYLTGSPEFPTFQLDHALVVLPDEQAAHLNETIGGQSYTGLSRTYLVYPQSAGTFRLPQAVVKVPYAASPPKTTVASLNLPALEFTAELPEAAKSLPYFLPTSNLTIRQNTQDVAHLKAGDSIERTITVTADRTQPMNLPPVQWDAPDGIRVYPKEPKLTNVGADRSGFLAGVREDRASFLILDAGDYELPAVTVYWWDLRAGKVREAVAPAIRFHADANPNFAPDLAPEPEPQSAPPPRPWWALLTRERLSWAGAIVAALVLVVWMGRRYFPALRQRMRQRAAERNESEPAYFSRLESALQSGPPLLAYNRLLSWRRKNSAGPDGKARLDLRVDDEFGVEVQALAAQLYSRHPTSKWSGEKLRGVLRHLRQQGANAHGPSAALPPLNPNRC